MKTLLKKISSIHIGAVLLALVILTAVVITVGYLFSDVLIITLLVLISYVAIFSLYLLANQYSTYKEKFGNLPERIDEKPSTSEVERLIKRNKHEIDDVIKKHTTNLYVQIESFHYIQQKINPVKPLPSMSGWASSPELALLILNIIEKNQHSTIVDVGSGVSSLIAGYAVKNTDRGKVLALDHEKEYYLKTSNLVEEHDLTDTVEVSHAPLKEYKLKNQKYQWYEDKKIKDLDHIDLLLVDGPPGKTQKHARYPALPLLYDKLSKGATVVLDDYFRAEETEIAEMWAKEYNLDLSIDDSSKGVAIFKKR